MNRKIKKQFAFTLIELLVVIAIIGILSALIVVGMNSTTQKATIAKAQVFSNSLRNSLMSEMVSEWKFDDIYVEGSDTKTADTRGINPGILKQSGYAGVCDTTHCPQVSVSGCPSSSCLYFDGIDDYVTTGNLANNLGQSFTVEIWSKRTGSTGVYGNLVQINTWGSGSGGFLMFDHNNGNIQGRIYSSADSAETGIFMETNVPNDVWRHYVFTWEKPYLNAYLNGVKLSPVTWNHDVGWTNNAVYIGYWSGYYFNGSLDGIRIYGKAVPTSQIQQNYFAGLNKLLSKRRINQKEYNTRVSELVNFFAAN
ncbi:MAG: LamG-like jellyroll fold domain-containing protein [Candidatus Paceibacterota bacterium]